MTNDLGPSIDDMSTEVLYRKWRPRSFSDVVGQEPVTRTIRNAVAKSKIAHAYLLCGPRGTGKTSLGRLIAKALNCKAPTEGEPCDNCEFCRSFNGGQSMDLVEMDAASNRGIDEIRKLRDHVGLAPMGGGFKVYLIDEVHMLTPEAYNALLKTLEEPPPHAVFVLATTEPHKVPATVISRCQRFDLKRIGMPAAVDRLLSICGSENLALDRVSLKEIARAAGGSLRDAINMLEQITAQYGASPTLADVQEVLGFSEDSRCHELARHILGQDLTNALRLVSNVRDDGTDIRQFSKNLLALLRDLLFVKAGGEEFIDASEEKLAAMKELAAAVTAAAIVQAIRVYGGLDFRNDQLTSLPLELALVDHLGTPMETDSRAAEPVAVPVEQAITEEKTSPVRAAAPAQPESESPQPPSLEPKGPRLPGETPATETTETSGVPAGTSKELTEDNAGQTAKPPQLGPEFLEQLRGALRDVNKSVSAFLNGSCEITDVERDEIVLGFYFAFHKGKIAEDNNRRTVEEVASRLLGRPVTLRCVDIPGPREKKAAEGHLVQVAREMGARPIGPRRMSGKKGESVGESRSKPEGDEAGTAAASPSGTGAAEAQ